MLINHVKETLILNIFDLTLTEGEILAYIRAVGFTDESILKAYNLSLKRKMPILAKALFQEEAVRSQFVFMNDSAPFFIKDEKILMLTLLYKPLMNRSFDEILEVIFGFGSHFSYRKRVGKKFKKFGTKLLNNIYVLSHFVDIHVYIDKILTLDHSKVIDEGVVESLSSPEITFDWLIENYCITRIFKILLTCEGENFLDSIRIINLIRETEGACYKEVVRKCIGRKPSSFYDIHLALLPKSYEITNHHIYNISLKQDIMYVDGESIYDYTISVPKRGEDLFITGATLKHCVGSYVHSVLNKDCQILNLKLKDKLVYTVELIPTSFGYRIGQFKGYKNSSEYEGPEGESYRVALLDKLNNKKLIS